MTLKPLQIKDLTIFNEQELWDQGKDIEEFYFDQELEEELLESTFKKTAKDIQYKVGDIIMANNFTKQDNSTTNSITSPHRILIITSTNGHNYSGFIMSSKVNKASVYKNGFKENILVDNVSNIITAGQKPQMPCIIQIDNVVNITDSNLDDYGDYKGHVSNDFLNFILHASNLYKAGEDTSKICWQNGAGRIIIDKKD